MSRTAATAAALAAALALPASAAAWDAPYAIRRDGEVTPTLSLAFGATLPLTLSPSDANALSVALVGAAGYVDDDKVGRLVVASLAAHSVFREQRERYEPSSTVGLTAFDLHVQLRLLPGLHLLYGLALMRSGPRAHARVAGLCLDLGVALPLLGDRSSMRGYRRGWLQVEAVPLVASFLGFLDLEGSTDRELPTPGAGSEVALRGGLETRVGTFEGDLRLTASYTQGSLYGIATARYVAPVLFWRIAPFAFVQYVWPGRPLRQHISEPGQRLLYHQNVGLFVGLSVRL